MKGSTIARVGKKSSTPTGSRPKRKKDIDRVFAEGTAIDEAVRLGVHDALVQHQRAGVPVAVWENGKVVLKSADQVLAECESDQRKRAKPRRVKARRRRSVSGAA